MRKRAILSSLLFIVLLVPWIGAAGRPVVVVSIPPQAWLVKRLAGEAVEVQTLLTSGANPHTYEPTARQVKKLAEASLYFTVGMPFEVPLVARVEKLNAALKIADMDAGVAKRGLHEHDHSPAALGHACAAMGDPHIWLSPSLMCVMASNAVAVLKQALPQQEPELAANFEKTLSELRTADDAVRQRLRTLKERTWVVYHPSWGYFADEYGLTLLEIEQDGKAPSARHLAEVIGKAKSAGVKYVFTEPQFDKRPAQTLATQVGARLVVIDPLQEDWPALLREVAEKLTPDEGRQ